MIKPTVGRVVWYHPSKNEPFVSQHSDGIQPCAAHICYVHSDTLVNLVVFDHAGRSHSRHDVELCQGDTAPSDREHCEWMPFQKGQAAKTEAVERRLEHLMPDKSADV